VKTFLTLYLYILLKNAGFTLTSINSMGVKGANSLLSFQWFLR